MSILSRLTVTPLLYVIGALLIMCAVLGVQLNMARSDTRAAESAQAAAESARDAAITERDAWKGRAEDNARAVNVAQANVATLKTELSRAQNDALTLAQQSREAIDAAEAARLDAERTLARFAAQFQAESRKPDCARALSALESACPAMRGY